MIMYFIYQLMKTVAAVMVIVGLLPEDARHLL